MTLEEVAAQLKAEGALEIMVAGVKAQGFGLVYKKNVFIEASDLSVARVNEERPAAAVKAPATKSFIPGGKCAACGDLLNRRGSCTRCRKKETMARWLAKRKAAKSSTKKA